MKLKTAFCIMAALFCAHTVLSAAEEIQTLRLAKPRTSGGKPLMQALAERKSSRDISGKELPPQLFADLLWAAAGVNRPESKKRTAPSAMNWQEISVYVATAKGLYLYNANANSLEPLVSHDIRPLSGLQSAAQAAPVLLLYVADYAKMGSEQSDMRDLYSAADTGFISQNVYLFCASEGLATVVMGGIDRPRLSKEMGLGPGQKVVLVQPVGYPKREQKGAKG
ncbi:MAG: SagB/ThcOx family dehydrogenase [Elusimicrobia bacterium]|nr:SagB/ThcOx family dehydrogenase [Elusimicrobiota bacterium]